MAVVSLTDVTYRQEEDNCGPKAVSAGLIWAQSLGRLAVISDFSSELLQGVEVVDIRLLEMRVELLATRSSVLD